MGFDYQNFGIGLATGWVTAYLIYRYREQIQQLSRSAQTQATSARNSVTRSADRRYLNELVRAAEASHLGGSRMKLTDVLVEPRFVLPPRLTEIEDEDAELDVFRVIPRVPDHPFLHAPYNFDSLSVDDLGSGTRSIALLGLPGSGRTTALYTIALRSLGQVEFREYRDRVQERLDADLAEMSDKDRSVALKRIKDIEDRARKKLEEEEEAAERDDDDGARQEVGSAFQRLLPVYVDIANIQPTQDEFGNEADPAEPLVRAVQHGLGRITAATIPTVIYKRLNNGQLLLLIDGIDDVPEPERPEKLNWLRAFMEQYRQNFVIIAGPAIGYGSLIQLGLTPVFMRPWHDLDIEHAADRWTDFWGRQGRGRRRKGSGLDPAVVERAKAGSRGLLPFEVVLKIWANYADDTDRTGAEGWLRAYIKRRLPQSDVDDSLLLQLGQVAALQLDEGYITRSRLESLAIGTDAQVVGDGADDADADDEPQRGRKKRGSKTEDTESTTAQGRLLGVLRRAGLLLQYRGDRYQFAQASIAAYLASLTLQNASTIDLQARAQQPAWEQALMYANLHTATDVIVRDRLNAPTDALKHNLSELARWLAYAPTDAPWRSVVLRHLGNLLVAPNQYPLARERMAAALVSSRDRNIVKMMERAVQNENPDVRRLACLVLGVMGDDSVVGAIVPLLTDALPEVQLAAGMSLGAIGTEAALEQMVLALTDGAEQLQQAMAEAFAAMPEEGHPILYDAINDPALEIRRAAVLGLRRLRTNWALTAIYRVFLEDEQWYVRSAAQQAFYEMRHGRVATRAMSLPQPEELEWLADWAAQLGENLPTGDGAYQMLIRALQEGEPEIRILAAQVLGQLGQVNMLRPIYGALRDRQEEVRVAAYHSLADLQMHVGEPLPTPV